MFHVIAKVTYILQMVEVTWDHVDQDQELDEEREVIFNQTMIFWIQAWEEKGQRDQRFTALHFCRTRIRALPGYQLQPEMGHL